MDKCMYNQKDKIQVFDGGNSYLFTNTLFNLVISMEHRAKKKISACRLTTEYLVFIEYQAMHENIPCLIYHYLMRVKQLM